MAAIHGENGLVKSKLIEMDDTQYASIV